MEIVWQTPANPPEACDYIIRDGKRFVRPYYFEFVSHVKNRWAGKAVVDLFAEEFTGRPREYYVGAVKSGRIRVDGQVVSLSYRVRSSQKISHFLHRHEPPVLAGSISILQEEPEVVTICKPASIPVHSCGQYRKNTVVGILQAEHGLTPLFPVHRLDRLVSGLLIFARNPSKADRLRQQIEAGLLHKEYIAKVLGAFPEGEQVVNANIDYNAREGRSSVEFQLISLLGAFIELTADDLIKSYVWKTADKCNGKHLKGKTACTKFTRMSTNGIHSIVLCKPITGRTHQIRVHLQHIGHPIANDELYLHHAEVIAPCSTKRMHPESAAMDTSQPSPVLESSHNVNSNEEFSIDPMCTNCPNLGPKGYDGDEEGLWLHCLRYSGPDWTYECPFPDWAFLS